MSTIESYQLSEKLSSLKIDESNHINHLFEPIEDKMNSSPQEIKEYEEFLIKKKTYHFKYPENMVRSEGEQEYDMSLVIINKTHNAEILTLLVSFCLFNLEINILNLSENSETHENMKIGSGSFGSIYLIFPNQKQPFVIKSIRMKKESAEINETSLKNSILEYCIYKIFSVLKIGPEVTNDLGFDLIIYSDAVEFSMEYCKHWKHDSLLSDTKDSLNLMHYLRFIHGDIKLENIMWSPAYEKNVFIDFGFTKLIKERYFEKTFTSYFGTYHYCSQEMKDLLNHKRKGFVNLFLNDYTALMKTLERADESKKIFASFKYREDEMIGKLKFQDMFQNNQLKKGIYMMDKSLIEKIIRENPTVSLNESTLLLLRSLSNVEEMIELSNLFFSHLLISTTQYNELISLSNNREEKGEIKNFIFKKIEQISLSSEGRQNWLMKAFLYCFNEDTTPIALYRKKYLESSFNSENLKLNSKDYWRLIVEYAQNTYVEREDIFRMFEVVKQKLNIENWEICLKEEFILYSRARQLSQVVYENYNINMWQMHEELLYAKRNRLEPEKHHEELHETEKTYKPKMGEFYEVEYLCRMKELRKEVISKDMVIRHSENLLILNKLKEEFEEISGRPEKSTIFTFFLQHENLQSEFPNSKQFFEKLRNFAPGMRTNFAQFIKEKAIEECKNDDDEKIKEFYKNSYLHIFHRLRSKKVLFKEEIHKIREDKDEFVNFVETKLEQIIEWGDNLHHDHLDHLDDENLLIKFSMINAIIKNKDKFDCKNVTGKVDDKLLQIIDKHFYNANQIELLGTKEPFTISQILLNVNNGSHQKCWKFFDHFFNQMRRNLMTGVRLDELKIFIQTIWKVMDVNEYWEVKAHYEDQIMDIIRYYVKNVDELLSNPHFSMFEELLQVLKYFVQHSNQICSKAEKEVNLIIELILTKKIKPKMEKFYLIGSAIQAISYYFRIRSHSSNIYLEKLLSILIRFADNHDESSGFVHYNNLKFMAGTFISDFEGEFNEEYVEEVLLFIKHCYFSNIKEFGSLKTNIIVVFEILIVSSKMKSTLEKCFEIAFYLLSKSEYYCKKSFMAISNEFIACINAENMLKVSKRCLKLAYLRVFRRYEYIIINNLKRVRNQERFKKFLSSFRNLFTIPFYESKNEIVEIKEKVSKRVKEIWDKILLNKFVELECSEFEKKCVIAFINGYC